MPPKGLHREVGVVTRCVGEKNVSGRFFAPVRLTEDAEGRIWLHYQSDPYESGMCFWPDEALNVGTYLVGFGARPLIEYGSWVTKKDG